MNNTSHIKKFIISFLISTFIFSLSAVIIAAGLSIGRSSDREAPQDSTAELDGSSFNILLVLSDYAPEIFDDYDPQWVKNTLGKNVPSPSASPSSALTGYRKVHAESMALLCFDRERARLSLIPISGSTLVNVKGLNVRLEDVAGEWGMDVLTQKVHALTGLEVDRYAVFTPSEAATAFDLIGDIDYTIKCNMKYSVPERGLSIDLTAGTYRLDGKTTVDMLRFDGYDSLGIKRSEITFGYARRLFNKINEDLTSEKLEAIILDALSLSYTDFDPSVDSEEMRLMKSCNKLNVEMAEMVGSWQTVSGERYFVPDETKTIENLSRYRKSNQNKK